MNNPQYSENLIVAIIQNKEFNWYILNKFLCLLDLNKLNTREKELYIQNHELKNYRLYCQTVNNSKEIQAYLDSISNFRIGIEELQLLMLNEFNNTNEIELDDFYPTVYIDMNNKSFYSQFPEYFDFEICLPNDWKFYFKDFTSLISDDNKYWIYKNTNLFEKIIEKNNKFKNKNYEIKFKDKNFNTNLSKNTANTELIKCKMSLIEKLKNFILEILNIR